MVVGFVGGDIPKVPTNLVLLKNCQVVGVFYGAFCFRLFFCFVCDFFKKLCVVFFFKKKKTQKKKKKFNKKKK